MTKWRRSLATAVLSLLLALSVSACRKDGEPAGSTSAASPPAPAAQATDDAPKPAALRVSDRKVIKTAELEVRSENPAQSLDEAKAIATRFGGHLVSSNAHGPRDSTRVVVTLKVEADRLDDALAALKRLGSGVGSEVISSQDVTEEYVDLDARLRTQKKLEQQFLKILEDAKSVGDALEVHKQLAQVRGEIERLEGKQRLLENQVTLSTITVRFVKQEPLVSLGGGRFQRAVVQAGADALNVGAAIVVGSIRVLGVLLPLTLLIFLPLGLLVRRVLRRLFGRAPTPAAAA
jgi:hypothetical protein